MAPTAIRRRASRLGRFRDHWDFDLDAPMLPVDGRLMVDAGDVPGDATDGAGNAARTTMAIDAILSRGAVPICLGGDDSVPIPILRAFAGRGPLTVLHLDAHLDFRDEIDGVRDGYSSAMRRAAEMPHVERIVQVGMRGVGSARADDVADARAAGNRIVTARQVREHGIGSVLELIGVQEAVFVSIDLDGLDPTLAPAVSAPAPGGLAWDEAVDLLAGIGPRLAGAVVTEYVPAIDVNDITALVAARLVAILARTTATP